MNKYIILVVIEFLLLKPILSQNFQIHQLNNIPVIVKNDTLKNAWAGGINSATISTNDFDKDGIQDILLFDRQNSRSLIFLVKSGKPVFSTAYNKMLPVLSRYAIFYDYNGDLKKDLFTANQNSIKLYRNESTTSSQIFKSFKNSLLTNSFGDTINMDISSHDIPAFSDVDNDGDMDILHFRSSNGTSVDLEKNISKETYNHADSLSFKNLDNCWGGFMENSCKAYNFGFDCRANFRLEHAGGGAVMAFDSDNDLDKDLILGKEDCNNIIFLQNQGSVSKAIFTKTVSDFPNSNSSTLSFPLPFNEDVDGDNVKDLIITTGLTSLPDTSDVKNNIWFYKNTGTNTLPVFSFKSKNFLQHSMIDLGKNTTPGFMDLNGDGRLDMLIGNSSSEKQGAYICTYLNIGTLLNPVFSLSDTNFLSLRSLGIKDLKFSFADLNNDGKNDVILNYLSGNQVLTSWYENKAITGFEPLLSKVLNLSLESVSSVSFSDIDNDGFLDLLAGTVNGDLNHFKNLGNIQNPSFVLANKNYGGIASNIGYTNGHLTSSIADLNNDNKPDLIIANDLGKILMASSFKEQNPMNFILEELTNPQSEQQFLGQNLSLSVTEISGNDYPDIFLGNNNGGVMYFQIKNIINGVEENTITTPVQELNIYPNPSDGSISINSQFNCNFKIIDLTGQNIYNGYLQIDQPLQIQYLAAGLYFVISENADKSKNCQKLIIK